MSAPMVEPPDVVVAPAIEMRGITKR